jgi:hypothetical protein
VVNGCFEEDGAMEQEHSTDESTRMKGRVLADMAMISVLVAYAQRDHPDFKEYAIDHFDRFLGRITIRDTGRDFNEMLVYARHRFQLMLSGSLDNDLLLAPPTQAGSRSLYGGAC